MKVFSPPFLILALLLAGDLRAQAQQCGRQARGTVCAGGLCCSHSGYCGSTSDYCTTGCQSQCSGGGGDLSSLISEATFNQMLLHRNDAACVAHGFYTYSAFITAANSFSGFGTTGDDTTRKREIAAFLGQTSHETTGGWPSAPDGPYYYYWGYCSINEQHNQSDNCSPSTQWPCAPGKKYYGRGPIQLTNNYNYGPAGRAIGYDLLNNPDAVATDPVISFKTAMWFWMTPAIIKAFGACCHHRAVDTLVGGRSCGLASWLWRHHQHRPRS